LQQTFAVAVAPEAARYARTAAIVKVGISAIVGTSAFAALGRPHAAPFGNGEHDGNEPPFLHVPLQPSPLSRQSPLVLATSS
jgi:hypothetical protein